MVSKTETVNHALTIHGAPSEAELTLLYELAENKDVLEVGCNYGRSSYVLASAAKRFTTVDNFIDNHFQAGVSPIEDFKRNMDGLNYLLMPMSSAEALKIFKGKLDFVFVDGAHDAPNVEIDIKGWWPKIKKGGFMAFHDCNDTFPGYHDKIKELLGEPVQGVDTIEVYQK